MRINWPFIVAWACILLASWLFWVQVYQLAF